MTEIKPNVFFVHGNYWKGTIPMLKYTAFGFLTKNHIQYIHLWIPKMIEFTLVRLRKLMFWLKICCVSNHIFLQRWSLQWLFPMIVELQLSSWIKVWKWTTRCTSSYWMRNSSQVSGNNLDAGSHFNKMVPLHIERRKPLPSLKPTLQILSHQTCGQLKAQT